MRLLLLGPPGAGKGTQAARISAALRIPAISTGDIFRTHIREQTSLGKRVQSIIESGHFVPDEVTNEIVFDRLQKEDARQGYLLDGYPRTVEQTWALREFHWQQDLDLDHVIELVVPDDILVSRLLKRSQIEGRADDNEDVIRERMKVYKSETIPISEMARSRGLLREVDGMGSVDDVFSRCMEVLAVESPRPPRPQREVER
ncbi:adenylate kinase [Austwickia chelonae]|uniref:adenylate kinase n=1 Tax=Austwickia chelonae TaxID=100225 RepID=UPI000E223826|nr:adenylate kinase [Austwickia chelonae]